MQIKIVDIKGVELQPTLHWARQLPSFERRKNQERERVVVFVRV